MNGELMRPFGPAGARFAALLLAFGLGLAGPLCAQESLSPFGDPDQRQEQLEPPLSLPQSYNGIVRPGNGEPAPVRVETLRDIGRAMQACWKPAGTPYSRQEITIRISFKRNGEVLGKPRITYYRPGEPGEDREAFTQAVRDAFMRCSPLPFSDRLGAAVAGRLFTFRFIDAPAPKSL